MTYYGAINCVYYVMGIDFTGRYHALFSLVVESLLCFLHERPVGLSPAQKLPYRIAVLSEVPFSITSKN